MFQAYPALPVRDMTRSREFYRDKVGLQPRHGQNGFAILHKDRVELHLWLASDESWRNRKAASPIVSGAESFPP